MNWLPYSQLIEVKRWADRGLCDAIARQREQLSEQEIEILTQILDHINVVDRIFQHHLQGLPHSHRGPRSEVLPTFETLAERVLEAGDWYSAYVKPLSPQAFEETLEFTFTSGKPARMSRGQILLHVCLHGSYHRGNAGAVLQLRGLTPGRDAITDYLEMAA